MSSSNGINGLHSKDQEPTEPYVVTEALLETPRHVRVI